jgi:enamine deaminase RidA (YjgF/YER057c/UK114 family)
MDIQRLNPPGLHETPGYHHVTLTRADRLAFLAGQCPLDADGNLVGPDDVLAQADQVAANALVALTEAGASPSTVVRSVIYVVVDDRTPALGEVWRQFQASPIGEAFTTASTLLGVARLGFTGQLVELDLTAVVPPLPPPTS